MTYLLIMCFQFANYMPQACQREIVTPMKTYEHCAAERNSIVKLNPPNLAYVVCKETK